MWEYYLFAIFAFALIGILILFAKFLFASRKKPEDIEVREEKLLRLYRQIEDMMESFEEYAEEVRTDMTDRANGISTQLVEFEKYMDSKVRKILDDKVKTFEKPMFQEITTENVIKTGRPEPEADKKSKAAENTEEKSDLPKSAQAQQLEKMKKEREAKKAAEKEVAQAHKEETKAEMVVRLYDEGNDEISIAKQMNMTTAEIRLMLQMNRR